MNTHNPITPELVATVKALRERIADMTGKSGSQIVTRIDCPDSLPPCFFVGVWFGIELECTRGATPDEAFDALKAAIDEREDPIRQLEQQARLHGYNLVKA